MTTYAIHATIRTHVAGFDGNVSVPTFYLDGDVQGITSAEHAAGIARGVLNPAGLIAAGDVDVRAYPVDPGRYTHVTRHADGTVAGWHRSVSAAEHFAGEAGPPLTIEPLQDEDVWRALPDDAQLSRIESSACDR